MPRHKQRRYRRAKTPKTPKEEQFVLFNSDSSSVSSSIADDYITNLLDQSDIEVIPTTISDSPSKRCFPKNSLNTSRFSTSSSSSSSPSSSPSPSRKHLSSRQFVLSDSMAAFVKFSQRQTGQTTHSCLPSPDARHRLALHRAAELLGATSSSDGTGHERYVVMKWPTGKRVPVSEAAYERGVTRILDELFPEKTRKQRGGRETQRELARRVRTVRIWDDDGDGGEGDGDVEKQEQSSIGEAEKVGHGNIGFDMLQKMGWREGTGLGAERDGRVDPIISERRSRRAGLGSM